jgi:hypothetical protein
MKAIQSQRHFNRATTLLNCLVHFDATGIGTRVSARDGKPVDEPIPPDVFAQAELVAYMEVVEIGGEEDLSDMNKSDLVKLAQELEITTDGMTKAELVSAIKDAWEK